jgi:hypothetical protein
MALSWALHDVSLSNLRPGDHIYRWASLVHVHHGIVLQTPDDNKDVYDRISVLHIPNNAAVEAKQETLGKFLGKGGSLKSARYGVPPIEVWIKRNGTCYAEQSGSAGEVLARANSLLQKSEQHCVFRAFRGATSEDIAFWCKTGKTRGVAMPNNTGGTNYDRAPQQRMEAADEEAESPVPQTRSRTSSNTSDFEMAGSSSNRCRDPDAFLLLQEGNELQQQATPQSVRRIEIPTNDADLEDYEVVDLPPWLPAEHYPAVVNAQA